MRLKIYFGGASPNCGVDVRLNMIQQSTLAHKNPTPFRRGSMSNNLAIQQAVSLQVEQGDVPFPHNSADNQLCGRALVCDTGRKDLRHNVQCDVSCHGDVDSRNGYKAFQKNEKRQKQGLWE